MDLLEQLSSLSLLQGLFLSKDQLSTLVNYLNLLEKWNKTYNLTAVRDKREMLHRHLMDSLSIVPYINGESIIDIGTGPGLPGIPLAICFPERNFTLLDSKGKKTRFLFQATLELGINNIKVINNRAENFQAPELFDTVVSRAFAPLSDMLKWTEHLCEKDGLLLAMKGEIPLNEIQTLPDNIDVETHHLNVAGLNASRHLVVMTKKR